MSTQNTSIKNQEFNGDNGVFPIGQSNESYAQYFIGENFLNMLTLDGVVTANVTFAPACRNNWHIHHKGGQILLITNGRGWYQEEGSDPIALKQGDVVNIPAGVKHWHGAAKDSWFAHVAIHVPAEGATNEWCEPVTDDYYLQLEV